MKTIAIALLVLAMIAGCDSRYPACYRWTSCLEGYWKKRADGEEAIWVCTRRAAPDNAKIVEPK